MTHTPKCTESVLDVKTHFNIHNLPQDTHRVFTEALLKEKLYYFFVETLLESILIGKIKKFKANLIGRGYQEKLTQETLSEVKFESRKEALTQKQKQNKRILPFFTQYQPSAPNLKLNTP